MDGAAKPGRINVAVNDQMLAAIRRVMDRENVSLTEAVRRLLSYGDFLHQAVKVDGGMR